VEKYVKGKKTWEKRIQQFIRLFFCVMTLKSVYFYAMLHSVSQHV